MTEPNDTPFFIIGVHRSGTTLLRYTLSSHPRIHIPPETDFIPYFFGKHPHEHLSQGRVSKILHVIFTRYRFIEDWQGPPPDPEIFYKEMKSHDPAGFLEALYTVYARQNNALRWGDKTPIYASYVDLIHTIFPNAKFLHIIRDPFDSAISLLEKYQADEFHIDIYFAARNWVRRIRAVQVSQNKLPPAQFLEVRYEKYVQDPEYETRKACDFLGEVYLPEMNEQHRLAQKEIPSDSHFFSNVRKPVFTQSIDRGRRDLSLANRRLIQRVAGPLMSELGYPKDDLGPMSRSEILRLNALRAKFETLQAGRAVLQVIGLFPPI